MRGSVAGIERRQQRVGTERLLQENFSTSGQRRLAQRRRRVRGQHEHAHVSRCTIFLDRADCVEPARPRQRPIDDDGVSALVANEREQPLRARSLDDAPAGAAQRLGIQLAYGCANPSTRMMVRVMKRF